jgi:hypothetical protein
VSSRVVLGGRRRALRGLRPEVFFIVDALTAVVSYAMGYTIVENARNPRQRVNESTLAQLPTAKFPHLGATAGSYATHVSRRAFDAGLTNLIDGLAAALPDKAVSSSASVNRKRSSTG